MYNSNINNKNNFFPILIFGILFFIFGLVSWVNAMLIPYFKVCCELTHTQSYFVALAFYIAYLVMSIPAAKLIGRIGYKKKCDCGAMAHGIRDCTVRTGSIHADIWCLFNRAVCNWNGIGRTADCSQPICNCSWNN